MGVTIENLVTSGTFSLDGGTWDVDNNVWIVGNDAECVIIDSPHDAAAIINQVKGRTVKAILLTHAHNDHIGAAREVAEAVGAPIILNREDLVLWEQEYPDAKPDQYHEDGDEFEVGGAVLKAIHTPGHSPGSTCFYLESEGTVFTGDTLFNGGPGATGRSYSDYPTILTSIRERLLTLPAETVVRTGHGDNTTIAAEQETLAKIAE
ncbi:beta-lactamase domain protein [Pseudarthrobacter chlorophenolicus A6]|uniref:Beta-lactamase domain protein n=1 Tax=Pseudarthrobacter chlorophenolicus (strain ATCC 700700 / DSM 12829 / CIP 107037 / JCM 12360 / KCTC 9906 / NCIMB 13794 / A6) TaxID=452863 RepID=B8HHD6_PSECP|nr:MBL fold metallo-hydrolase [Pseudarthrobacter chlorophenolicus]ACL41427.1 beta-lactamase domain protein [Pseudarthrobacter chlorophenolicus A6]SDQ64332.1 Glyoxylase, beta-lactamase superfamily II [Pseudarthrobacter chlorophenolicus]